MSRMEGNRPGNNDLSPRPGRLRPLNARNPREQKYEREKRDSDAAQLIHFVRNQQGIQREAPGLTPFKKAAPLPEIGRARGASLDLSDSERERHMLSKSFGGEVFNRDDERGDDFDIDLGPTDGSVARTPTPTHGLGPSKLGLSNSYNCGRDVSKLEQGQNNLQPPRQHKRLTGTNSTPEFSWHRQQSVEDLPDRPSAPSPNQTPPFTDTDDDDDGLDSEYRLYKEEPLDFIDEG